MHTNTTLQDLSLKIHEYNTFFFLLLLLVLLLFLVIFSKEKNFRDIMFDSLETK